MIHLISQAIVGKYDVGGTNFGENLSFEGIFTFILKILKSNWYRDILKYVIAYLVCSNEYKRNLYELFS